MNKILKISLWVLLAIVVIGGLIFAKISHQQKVCKSLQITIDYNDSEVFLSEDEVKSYLIKKNDSIVGKTISEINENLIESTLNDIPYVYSAEVFVGFNADVNINLIQSKPLVRIFNKQNQQFYLDDKGVKMPVKQGVPARVVVANGNISSVFTPFISSVSSQRSDTSNLIKDTELFSVFKIAEYLSHNEIFKAQIEEGILSIEEVEKEFLGFSSSYVTAQIFKHWKLSPNLINSIEFVDDINSVSKEFERKAKILSVIKTVANIKEPLSEKSIKEGIIKAKEYGFDTKILAQTIENLKTKIDLY